MRRIKVRHNKAHAVWAVVEDTPDGVRLVGVEPYQGPVPEVAHLLGAEFPDNASVRRALIAAMKGPVGDTLDNVLLSKRAYDAWLLFAQQQAARLASEGVHASAISDEMAEALPDGSLKIWVTVGEEEISMLIPPEEWSWKNPPS
ncbi:MAG: hypothetical protein D6775_14040 [Caldilineae bacterium]|nr:MAG: hypothetical protein D6775_14040 [Caldilineae bacterium]